MSPASDKTIILITGSLGAGKTAILRLLARLGHGTLDAERLAYLALRAGSPAIPRILSRFGNDLINDEGGIDRMRLHQAVRADPRGSADLQAILYPIVRARVEELAEESPGPLVFVETQDADRYALRDLADQIWLIFATPEERIENLINEHGWAPPAAARFVHTAPPSAVHPAPDLVLQAAAGDGDIRDKVILALEAMGWQQPRQTRATAGLDGAPPKSEALAAAVPVPDISVAGRSGQAMPRLAQLAPKQHPPSGVAETTIAPPPAVAIPSLGLRELRLVSQRLVSSALILLAIAFLTSWGLILAEYGRQHLPIQPAQAAAQAVTETVSYLTAHPPTYFWQKDQILWVRVVGETLGNSAGLLLVSMTAAVLLGFPLGMAAARNRGGPGSALMVLLSVAGASTPSFFFGMILWVVNIWFHRAFDIKVLPATGFGWDAHLVMPALVLAMRPMAQIAQITYVSVREALGQDYIRTAHSKGLFWRAVQNRHLLPNVLIPILNTLGASLRFSLASLPIVEVFFNWPGVGMRLLDAIGVGNDPLVIDLILSLGLFFLVVNLLIEFSFPLIDPRLRADAGQEARMDALSPTEWARQAMEILSEWTKGVARSLRRRVAPDLPPLPSIADKKLDTPAAVGLRRPSLLATTLRNPAFVLGAVLLLGLAFLSAFGEKLPEVNPYQLNGVMSIAGEYSAPPFKPSPEFSWGSDHLGRDMRSLVLAGARRTMTLVFFGMLARIVIGATFGLLAGWARGSWFDRMVSGATAIWAAFPATLFAMIVIQALGIQQGMWVFVVAISIVGWGEVAQIVRAHVAALKPLSFIESGRSIGARTDQILFRHVLPNVVNPLTVLAALEMGGILMLLAELGFLNIFMGGGFRAVIGESGGMVPIVATYSDVPEWSALIANVRQYWRSYPWMALYPGMAIFLSIMSFNLFGEGLRRFLEVNAIGLGRFLNRYTLMASAGVAIVLALVLRSAAPLNQYRADGLRFDQARAFEDVRLLSDPLMQGRETGTAGADLAAIYIAQRMSEIGLAPGGEHNSYTQRLVQPRIHLLGVPELRVLEESGAPATEFTYRTDFSEMGRYFGSRGEAKGPVMGVAYGPRVEGEENSQFGLSNSDAMDHVIIVRKDDLEKVVFTNIAAVLVVADDASAALQRRDVYPYVAARTETFQPVLWISPEIADRLLGTAGSSLAELDTLRESQGPSTIHLTGEGATVELRIPADRTEGMLDEAYINVIGVIAGQGYMMGMDEQIIMVSAYYDGVGTDPLGIVYPGANDNASGVATMLELARLLKTSSFQPDKTVMFVAWTGGERQEGLSITNILNARPGAIDMTVETVIELSGVGYGTGEAISIGNDSSYRLVQLFQEAAKRYDTPTTTLGRGPHYDLPARSIFGGRDATTLSLSWDGSDDLVHTPEDTAALIDPGKMRQVGTSTYLTLLVLCRETEY